MEIIILSIFSEHAEQIYEGSKRAELRKSFAIEGGSLIFLYETSPRGAVTGGMLISKASRLPLNDAIDTAENLGISRERALKYYGDRDFGWVLEIGYAFKFDKPIPLVDLQRLNHYFRPPQVFLYLNRYEGVSRFLLNRFWHQIAPEIALKSVVKRDHEEFHTLVMDSVGTVYDDIDSGFVQELLTPSKSEGAGFSSAKRIVKKLALGKLILGYTTLTIKQYGAVKTGPTVFRANFRGLGLGELARKTIETYLGKRGCRVVYCTCPSSRPEVVGYLVNSGMIIRAILCSHLGADRNEYVLSKNLEPTRVGISPPDRIPKLSSNISQFGEPFEINFPIPNPQRQSIKNFIERTSGSCYFPMSLDDVSRLFKALENYSSHGDNVNFKPKRLFAIRARNSKLVCVVMVTYKRSNMCKLNLFIEGDNALIARTLLEYAMIECPARRYYMTLQTDFNRTAIGMVDLGFDFEGRIPNPFGGGDHMCLGKISATE